MLRCQCCKRTTFFLMTLHFVSDMRTLHSLTLRRKELLKIALKSFSVYDCVPCVIQSTRLFAVFNKDYMSVTYVVITLSLFQSGLWYPASPRSAFIKPWLSSFYAHACFKKVSVAHIYIYIYTQRLFVLVCQCSVPHTKLFWWKKGFTKKVLACGFLKHTVKNPQANPDIGEAHKANKDSI